MNLNTNNRKKWHVVYTRSRCEKKVYNELILKNIECFLPLQKKLRQWKDRKKWVETPLISGYCFVNIDRKEYDKVLQTDYVVCYITFEGKAAIIPNHQINSLKTLLRQNDIEVNVSHENFEKGKKVEIISGPMIGMRGELAEIRGNKKFLLRFDEINSVVLVEINQSQLSYIPEKEF